MAKYRRDISEICKDRSRSLVGKLCKKVEILQQEKDLSVDQLSSLFKNLAKETVYEEFRELRNTLIFYQEGRVYIKFEPYNPPTKR